ncbi:MAG: alpha-glucuronidase [Bacteroidales bacterium]|nr:alpha-glucuronidase [Bacteroidales bacterium]MCM1415926.1 alpha-glucuronidase [bacterium]MCM1422654.1 alpha-glucuronidase [bacterium]
MGFEQAWLTYMRKVSGRGAEKIGCLVVTGQQDRVIENAVRELQNAFAGLLDRELKVLAGADLSAEKAGAGDRCGVCLTLREGMAAESYHLFEKDGGITIEASDSKGILYGAFDLIRQIQTETALSGLDRERTPAMPLRMLNHWDNMDGSIERGYSGESFFFENNEILVNDRSVTYARLAASVGINAVVINNVNVKEAATWLITDRYLERVRALSEVLAGYGIKLYLSLNYAAPIELGELESADPLDKGVRAWWKERMKLVFGAVPELGGFLIKADSEGRPGPFTYGRTHADGANMLAEAAAPYGGLIIWRCFVYNCQQDWRDQKTDRARSGYDNFIGLDGQFLDNVVLQIKNGPMDFQVREPVHPLFGGLQKTNQILEVQIAQEYTGQQRHVCYLIPMFQEILRFRTYVKEEDDTVRDIVSGRTFSQHNCGMAAVANTGNDENWTGHDLAAANWYGFGRLCFEPELSAEEIAAEWIELTFGSDEEVRKTLLSLLLSSWQTYEKYTSPLGIGWMVNPNFHYGPNVDGYEYSRWGTYHRADHLGIGVDRSHEGTGYALLYREPHASVYDDKEKCPDELLLFFHHIPYTWKLHSGKTVIQHIYDTHFEGAEIVDEMAERFGNLQGRIEEKPFQRIAARLREQQESAREWRDQINTYFYRKSGVSDEKNRKIY